MGSLRWVVAGVARGSSCMVEGVGVGIVGGGGMRRLRMWSVGVVGGRLG